MNSQDDLCHKEQEAIIQVFQKYENAELRWQNSREIEALLQEFPFREKFKVPFSETFLEKSCRANALKDITTKGIRDMLGRSVIEACIACCEKEYVIKRIVAVCFAHWAEKIRGNGNLFYFLKGIAQGKNPTTYKHLLLRGQIFTLLKRTSLCYEIILYKIMGFVDTPLAPNKYEIQDLKEYLEKNYSNFTIKCITREEVKVPKLLLLKN